MRATTRKSPEASVKGRPRGSVASRARKGSTAATPGSARRNSTISGGRSPTRPSPAAGLAFPEVRAQGRLDPVAHGFADRGDHHDHRERHAERHRQGGDRGPVAGERAAEEACGELPGRAEEALERPGPGARGDENKQRRRDRERGDDEADRGEPEERESVHGAGPRREGREDDEREGPRGARREAAAADRLDRARAHGGEGSTRVASAAGSVARSAETIHGRGGAGGRVPAAVISPSAGRPLAGPGRFKAARARKTPPASPRSVPRMPMERPSATKTAKIDDREAPSARSVAISGRRRRTEIETALAMRNMATRSVSEASALRLKRKARTIRSAVAAERPGDWSVRPAGRTARTLAAIASRGCPASSAMSTRSTEPSFPRSRCAVKRSVTSRSPPAARATPVNSRSAATLTTRRTPPATIRRLFPAVSPCRRANSSGTKTASGARRVERRASPMTFISRTALSPPGSTPRT